MLKHFKIWQKALLGSFAWALPSVLLFYYFIQTTNETIEFARKEWCGDQYNRHLGQILQDVLRQRDTSARASGAVDQSFAALDALSRETCVAAPYSVELQTEERYAGLKARWQDLERAAAAPPANSRAAAYSTFIDELAALYARVGDTSNLILDSDLDTYYIMDLTLLKFPKEARLLADLQSFATSPGRDLTAPAEKATLIAKAANLEANLEEAARNVERAYQNNSYYPATRGTLKPAIDGDLQAYLVNARRFVGLLQGKALEQPSVTSEPRTVDDAATLASAALARLYGAALDWEDRAFLARIEHYSRRKNGIIVLVIFSGLLSAVFVVRIIRDTTRIVRQMISGAERMARGELGVSIPVRGGTDEISALTSAFNQMAADLKRNYESVEETVRMRTRELREKTDLVELLQIVAVAANEAASVEETMQTALDRVCAYTGWPVGHAYLLAADGSEELASTKIWHLEGQVERLDAFRGATETMRFPPHSGLPGRVLSSGKPAWIIDVTEDDNFPRRDLAKEVGLRAAFAFPLLVERKVVGVLEFFSPRPLTPDPALLEVMANVGAQLGRVIERKRAEKALREARDAAEAADRAKSAFLASVSHEVRTPLNAVIGMSSLLLDTALTREQTDFAATIRTSAESLLAIINDILDFSKIEAGKLELEAVPLDLRQCVESALDLLAAKAAEKEIELVYDISSDTPEFIVGDLTRLRQVLANLLSNAVKFTHRGEVVISVARGDSAASAQSVVAAPGFEASSLVEIQFSVRDTGVGIPKDRMDRLFRSFSQVDASTTRKYGGTGLGLAISKRLVEMLGGRMWVESDGVEGRGATFHFTIRAAPLAAPIAESLEDKSALSGKRVLVVDDNTSNREQLISRLEAWGMAAVGAETGPAAAARIRARELFDVGILDAQMTEMDGGALAAEIRRLQQPKGPPIVLLTPLGWESDADGLGVVACLTKPVKQSSLHDVLIAIFAKDRRARAVVREPIPKIDSLPGERLRLRILLAEDNLTNQKVALALLERLGYRADVAGNGLEALEALGRQPYDIVLMDLQMPEMDGLEATRRLRSEIAVERQPYVVAVTADATKEDREACIASGMDDYVSKPVDLRELDAALQRSATRTQGRGGPAKAASSTDSGVGWVVASVREPRGARQDSLEAEVLRGFREEAPALVAAMRAALESNDAEAFRRAAHTLKGLAKYVAARPVAELSAELEQRGKSGLREPGEPEALLGRLEAELERLINTPAVDAKSVEPARPRE